VKRVACYLFAILLAGCHQPKPKLSEEKIRAIRALAPGMTNACVEKLRWGGIDALPTRSDQCFKFERPKIWKGRWVNEFEGSIFCAAGSPCPDRRSSYDEQTWLEFSPDNPVQDKFKPGGVYDIEFVGRRSIGAGMFGHFGVFRNDMIVDHLISMKQVVLPPEPTKQHVIADMKRCEADKSCVPD
jgi:hypothetical protein